jgi:TRAP-type mannitol/chloroaromatic compound transport system permease small subunit
MKGLLAFSRIVDNFTEKLGRWVAWFVVLAAVISAGNAIVRKVFDTSSNAWLELQWWLFGAVFLLCASWTLSANEHIRIDIVSNLLSRRARNIIDVVGHTLFLIPICLVMLYTSVPFVWRSLLQNEQSSNAGGLPVYPPKAFILLGFAVLLAQALSELIKRIAIMRGDLAETSTGGGHHAAAEAEAKRLLEEAAAPTQGLKSN